jgi:hypothetical protein
LGAGGSTIHPPYLQQQADHWEREHHMQIDKQQVIDILKSMGHGDKASQAESELPDQVDPERDSGLLSNLGIDVNDLLTRLPGGLGDKLGGLGDKLGGLGG